MKQFLYETVYRDLLDKIEQGVYAFGDQLPPESALCRTYDVSIITVRKALDALRQAGIIQKIKGKGSIVAARIRTGSRTNKTIAVLDIPFPSQMTPHYPQKDFPPSFFCDKNNWSHQLYSSLYASIPKNYNVLLAYYDYDTVMNDIGSTVINSVERIFLLGYFDKALIDFLHEHGKLVLAYNCFDRDIEVCSVSMDNRDSVYRITDYLYSLGHTRIAAINGDISVGDSLERATGYQERIISSGNRIDASCIKWGNMTFESGYFLAGEILDSDPDVTALVCVNDNVALGALYAVRERGLRCPEDISITGHDNNEFVNEIVPDFFTTADAHLGDIGRKVAELLVRPVWIDDRTMFREELLLRGSVAPPRAR